jgi:hypothetical protein
MVPCAAWTEIVMSETMKNNPENELNESRQAERDELRDSELNTVTGGVSDLGKYITKAVDDAISAVIGGNTIIGSK